MIIDPKHKTRDIIFILLLLNVITMGIYVVIENIQKVLDGRIVL